MEPLTPGTFVGAGSFCCQRCGYVLTLVSSEALTECPACGGRDFERASLFSPEDQAGHASADDPGAAGEGAAVQETARHGAMLSEPARPDRETRLARVREQIAQAGSYLCYEDAGELRTVPLAREWMRIGRSLAADLRFDDPTVSRRHALIVRAPDGVRVLDDRSLNGVFVNGARVEAKRLADGDEIIVGRYRLSYLDVLPGAELGAATRESGSPDSAG